MEKMEIPLFREITLQEWEEMELCGCMQKRRYKKGEMVFGMDDVVHEVGIVCSGGVNIENIDLWGNKSILSHVSKGNVFAETYAFCQEPMRVDVVAVEDSEILFLNRNVLLDEKHVSLTWSAKLVRNLLQIAMQKNLILSQRIFCTAPKTIRSRLLIYLSAQARRVGSDSFAIPFDRQQLADYLNLDRSALSKELGKMRDEGILEFHKNQFRVLDLPE